MTNISICERLISDKPLLVAGRLKRAHGKEWLLLTGHRGRLPRGGTPSPRQERRRPPLSWATSSVALNLQFLGPFVFSGTLRASLRRVSSRHHCLVLCHHIEETPTGNATRSERSTFVRRQQLSKQMKKLQYLESYLNRTG